MGGEQMTKRCVIVGGADINNYDFIRKKLCADDFVIFCDSGLKHMKNLQMEPILIVGDFDSHENPPLDVKRTKRRMSIGLSEWQRNICIWKS